MYILIIAVAYLIIAAVLSVGLVAVKDELKERHMKQFGRPIPDGPFAFATIVVGLCWPAVLVGIIRARMSNKS